MSSKHRPIALVTGASSGIGKALVKELLHQGYEVIGVSRSQEKLAQVKSELDNDSFLTYACDVSSLESVKDVTKNLKEKNIIPQLFFLNAGIAGESAMEPVDKIDLEIHERIFVVNYFGVLNWVKEWLEPCRNNGMGTFVVTSSINAIFAPPGGSAYSASKAAIAKAFDGFRLAHSNSGLKFLTVFSGPVDTPGLAGKLPFTWSPEKMAKYMITKAKKGKARSNPSLFYSTFCKTLDVLPDKMVFKILNLLAGSNAKNK